MPRRRPHEHLGAHLHLRRGVPHQERGPLVDAPEALEVVPGEEHGHAVGAVDELLDQGDALPRQRVLLRDAALVHPEGDLLPSRAVVEFLLRNVHGDNPEFDRLDVGVGTLFAHDLLPPHRRAPGVRHEAVGAQRVLREKVVARHAHLREPEGAGLVHPRQVVPLRRDVLRADGAHEDGRWLRGFEGLLLQGVEGRLLRSGELFPLLHLLVAAAGGRGQDAVPEAPRSLGPAADQGLRDSLLLRHIRSFRGPRHEVALQGFLEAGHLEMLVVKSQRHLL
mmetsp:Transcript_13100/g.28288  ORF Transcript_13100/g.28288 Transcript_13100/m.28288 type:complete len:279 (-) Transcript_13100:563-1399(-)